MLFDTHIHFFPDKLKDKVFNKLFLDIQTKYYRDETLESTLKHNAEQGVTHSLALHIATNPTQQEAVNNFAVASQCENIFCFGSVHPKSENAIDELHRIKSLGLKGIKLHPDFQNFFVDSTEMHDIYRTCGNLGLIIAFHVGRDPSSPDIVHSHPKSIRKIADLFPTLTIIAAHAGGMDMYDECLEYLCGAKNVYFDTAYASHFLNVEQMKDIIQSHGEDKILFGTDSPWSTAQQEKDFILKCKLGEEIESKIFYKNAFILFKTT